MAVEVHENMYLHTPSRPIQRSAVRSRQSRLPQSDNPTVVSPQGTSSNAAYASAAKGPVPAIPSTQPDKRHEGVVFRHNPLHDVESVFWLSMFMLLVPEFENNELEDGKHKYSSKDFQHYMTAQHDLAWLLFHRNNVRVAAMMSSTWLRNHMHNLLPTVREVLGVLADMRDIIATTYQEAEMDLKPGSGETIQMDWTAHNDSICAQVTKIMAILKQKNLAFIKDVSKQRRRPVKPLQVIRSPKGNEEAVNEVHGGEASGINEDQDGPRKKMQKTHVGDDVTSSSRIQPPFPSLTTYMEGATNTEY